MPGTKQARPNHYLEDGIRFLRMGFHLPFYADILQVNRENKSYSMTYRIPLRRDWLQPATSIRNIPDELTEIHSTLADALLWTNLGKAEFTSEWGDEGQFSAERQPAQRADGFVLGTVTSQDNGLDVFKSAMVLVLTMQVWLAARLEERFTRHGSLELPLSKALGDAIASILQTAADPTLSTTDKIAEHYVESYCSGCHHFRGSTTLPESGFCNWAHASVPDFLRQSKYDDPLWRVFVAHPRLQSGFYNPEEREEAAQQYRDRVAQWFDEEDQVTLDPITLHLVEDMLHAARSEDELHDTDTVLPRALRLMDFWHSGYLPPSGESHQENPTLLTALETLPDALLPIVLSTLTVLPPQYICIGFLPDDTIEMEVATLQLGLKPLRDILLQSIPRRVLELLASSFANEGNEVSVRFMRYLYDQANISFERIMMDYEGESMSWLFEPTEFHLTDVLHIHARLDSFVRDVTQETIKRIHAQET